MALVKSTLAAALKNIADNPPTSHAQAASQWANAIVSYASSVTPPSTTVSTGQSALQGVFTTAFASNDAAPSMETAMADFGATIAGGMAPFVAVPPVGSIGFAGLWSGTTDDTQAAADELAEAIDDWMKTGTATNTAVPPVTVNWS